jgi:uncharacterized protein YydD (DUF2326 family)
MIHRIFSTLKSFKELHFKPGLNVLLADKGPRSTAKHTRNRAGKSSVLEIIHFLTAAECPDDSIFRCPELIQHRFGMEFDLAGQTVSVERSGASPNDVVVSGGDSSRWPLQPALSAEKGETILPVKDWARVLGALVFGLDDATGRSRAPYSPTFRSLFPYFVRRSPGGFSEPHLHFVQTKPAVWQVGVSYLLGLDWTIPQEWQIVRDEETEIRNLKAAVGEGDLAQIVGEKAQLRADIATAESTVMKFRERIDSFRVLPDFRDYERRAAQLTQQMADLCDGNTLDEELLAELGRAVSQEKPPPIADLRRAYGEVGIALPELTLKRFDEVQKFHESVISNRKSYLEGEIELAKARIEKREADKRSIESERQQIMEILKSHGALDQFSRLQADYGRKTADLELLRKRFAAAEKIEEGLAKLRIRRQQLLLRLKQDYTEQSALLNRAIVTFEEISSQLYQTPAKFTPTETANGPQFKVEVQGERSPGIGNMQIFCFDMMLMKLLFDRNMGPGFLFHDSHLFDPVDARQVGTALALGSTLSQELHFQYVVTLNSDKQIEPPPDFRLSDFQMSTKLTDATESGGLFGIRFG